MEQLLRTCQATRRRLPLDGRERSVEQDLLRVGEAFVAGAWQVSDLTQRTFLAAVMAVDVSLDLQADLIARGSAEFHDEEHANRVFHLVLDGLLAAVKRAQCGDLVLARNASPRALKPRALNQFS